MKRKVSIVILNWNGRNHLKKCLNSIKNVNYKPLEVIVVDNNSTDGSTEMIRKDFPWVKLIINKKNLGYSGGNNKGIKECSGDYVFILNNDTEVSKDFLFPLIDKLESDPKIGCVQPQLLYGTDHNFLNAVGSYLTSTGFLYHYGYRKNAKLPHYNKPLEIYSAKGAAMLFRKSALLKVGLFDEDFFIFFEETDLCHRLWLSGFSIWYEPKSKIYHYEAVDTNNQMKDFTRNYLSFRNRICSFLKNLEIMNIFAILLILFPIYAFLFLFYLVLLKPHLSFAVIKGIGWNIWNYEKTLKKRNFIQRKLRKIPDKELFLKIKKDPPFVYYYYLFTTLKNYKNEKPI